MSQQVKSPVVRHAFLLLAAMAASLATIDPRVVSAEPVLDRVFSEADAVTSKSCAVVRIGFNFRVRYIGHFPSSNGHEVRIDFKAIDPEVARAEILTRRLLNGEWRTLWTPDN